MPTVRTPPEEPSIDEPHNHLMLILYYDGISYYDSVINKSFLGGRVIVPPLLLSLFLLGGDCNPTEGVFLGGRLDLDVGVYNS